MAERDPIDLIKDQLSRWEELTGLHSDHELFKQWQVETRTILEKAFNPKSTHIQNFMALRFREVSVKAFDSPEIHKINSARYKRDLESAKNVLLAAIKELNLDRTLFKKIQTTPKTVEVSLKGEYYISRGITEPEIRKAIQLAFEGSGLISIHDSESQPEKESLNHRMEQIRRARVGIYDLSFPQKEGVLFELGLALGMGKEVTITYKKGAMLPEMTRTLPGIEYENLPDLTDKLKKRLC
ncbi:MAG: hypothetical protein FJ107_05190 [Deltaproteobacteria bacterium]|nr:hypothetical protein [Deltaproteobacteria bacterium]MBM4347511.1 hypothetical protein [Deltaproteobacteria bacterium]